MLPPGAPCLNRQKCLEVYAELIEALQKIRRLQVSDSGPANP
jgi:hypothetical protein